MFEDLLVVNELLEQQSNKLAVQQMLVIVIVMAVSLDRK